ncbi:MAG: Asp-tRNA(Asn)/Glu-tRNA(Gln) amidotransferase GatCAB subunit A, partial [Gammaproteobacteria bacterium]|nr:Asp-tRNA(Asn)/Glu-tRNA(Gln) amidotransferase GatCAB subunit A [Gammaproteobacteria bacterium]
MLRSRDISSHEILEMYIQRISEHDSSFNSYITLNQDVALEKSIQADRLIESGDPLPLTGIPYAGKDIFCTQGIKTTCGSKMLENFIPPYDATVISNLNNQGAILIGKTNMDEFAMGSSNETSYFGPVHNPWDLARSPGGSSGGSAVAVAAGLAPIALGTDTGGSIRQPAAFTGITGLKPSYGRCSRYGMVAFASSLDQAGILALTAEDTAILLESLAGFDPMDSTSVEADVPKYSGLLNVSIEGKTVGIPKEFFDEGLDAESEQVFLDAIKVYESLGVQFKDISLP